jgi:hypothetical protein
MEHQVDRARPGGEVSSSGVSCYLVRFLAWEKLLVCRVEQHIPKFLTDSHKDVRADTEVGSK